MSLLRRIVHKIYSRYLRPNSVIELTDLIDRGLVVGRNFNMLDGVIIDESHCWHITIGDDVTLAPRVHILAHDASTKMHLNYTRIGKVMIGSRVFIGASSVILPGVKIGSNVVIGAGSVVTRDIPDNVVAAGNPAKIIGSFQDFIKRKEKEMEVYPCFGEEYTIRNSLTHNMKADMNKKMEDGYGYVI